MPGGFRFVSRMYLHNKGKTTWADEAKVYTEAVAFNSLKAGDVLTDGFSITKNTGDYIKVKGYKKDSGTAETEKYSDLLNACTYPGGVVITVSDYGISGNFTPYADGKDANAWIVSKKEVNGSVTTLYLDGYNYLPAIALTEVTKGKQWKIESMPASNIELQVEYFAESNLFLSKDALADEGSIAVKAGDLGVQFGDDGKSANTVTEGTPMTVTYNGTKKVLGMKAAKKAPALLSIEIGGHVTATIYYFEGETWEQAIQNHPTENSAWKIDHGYISGNGVNLTAGGNPVSPNSTIDPKADYHLWWT